MLVGLESGGACRLRMIYHAYSWRGFVSTLKLIPIRFPSDLIQAIDRLSGP